MRCTKQKYILVFQNHINKIIIHKAKANILVIYYKEALSKIMRFRETASLLFSIKQLYNGLARH